MEVMDKSSSGGECMSILKGLRVLRGLSVGVMLMGSLLSVHSSEVYAIGSSKEVEERLQGVEERMEEAGTDLTSDKRDLVVRVQELGRLRDELAYVDRSMGLIEDRVEERREDLVLAEDELADLRIELYALEGDLRERDGEFRERVRAVYREHQVFGYLDILMSADSLEDLVWRMGSYRKVLASDQEFIDRYVEDVTDLGYRRDVVEGLIDTVNGSLADLAKLEEDLADRRVEKAEIEDRVAREVLLLEGEVARGGDRVASLSEELASLKRTLVEVRESERLAEERRERLRKEAESRLEAERKSSLSEALEANLSDSVASESSSNGGESSIGSSIGIDVGASVEAVDTTMRDMSKVEILNLVKASAKKYGIPYELVAGVIQQESAFNPRASNVNTNGTMDRGLMQINSNTGPGLARQMGLKYEVGMEFVPEIAVEMGSYYLAQLYNERDLHRTLSSYNRGPAGARAWAAEHGTFETEYSRKVMGYVEQFKRRGD